MEPRNHLISQRLSALAEALRHGRRWSLSDFWEEVARLGAPLVESIPGDCDHHWVTFLYRGGEETQNALLAASFTGYDPVCGQMRRLPDSDVWYRTWRMPSDTRTTYQISPNDVLVPMAHVDDLRARTATWGPDDLNPHKMVFPVDGESGFKGRTVSVLEMPKALPQIWTSDRSPEARGRVELHRFRSERLGNERRVWVHLPHDHRGGRKPPGILVILDGMTFVTALSTPVILDNLTHAGKIRPLVTLMVDTLDQASRSREFACYLPYADFLATELIPWARAQYGISADPADAVLSGPSHGGLAAAFAAVTHPGVFGNVVAQSGSFWWSPEYPRDHEWFSQLMVLTDRLPIRFWLEAGRLDKWRLRDDDPTVLTATRHLRDILRAKGYEVHYHEFTGGHDYNCWQASFPLALTALAPPR